jgi:hypothetical protein
MRHLVITVAAVTLTALLGCGDRRTAETGGVSDTSINVTTPDAPEAPVEARDFAFADRQEFGESIRQQLAELDSQIEELSAQAKSRGGAVSDRALERIRTSRRAVDRNLAQIDNATAATWEDVKGRVNQAVESLAETVEGAFPK